jgi:23S rRNA (guanine2445-N2)-methyltransferase / 23S rRNA (guanine2069-N7)-methyltransferase
MNKICDLEFFATTAKGMEPLLVSELQEWGAIDCKEVRAGVQFAGPMAIGYKACLYSRVANRILLVVKTIPAHDADELYEGVRTIHWQDHLSTKKTFAVDFLLSHSRDARNPNIIHTHFGALKVKDAIVDYFRDLQGSRPSVDPVNPDVRVNVYLHQDEATVSIDLSGESLHRRGYRREGTEAPLKENLAAAIVMLTDFHRREDLDFLDPMCGSGTICIEAALMKRRIAPGLLRKNFGFMGWLCHRPELWQKMVDEATGKIHRGRKKFPKIVGYDKDQRAIKIALGNLEQTGLAHDVHFEVRDISKCERIGDHGVLVTNPPYGERLGEIKMLSSLYKQLGDVMKQKFAGWEGYIFTGNMELAKSVGLKASRRFVLFNGSLECRLLKYELY